MLRRQGVWMLVETWIFTGDSKIKLACLFFNSALLLLKGVLDMMCSPSALLFFLEHKQLLKNAQLELKKSKRKDYYKILGVDKNASEDEIKKAYRKRALMHHPGTQQLYPAVTVQLTALISREQGTSGRENFWTNSFFNGLSSKTLTELNCPSPLAIQCC